jgi:Zn-dependent protease
LLATQASRKVLLMLPTRHGSLRLFRFAGIEVFLHWSWFIVAIYEFNSRTDRYSSPGWCVVEYLTLFAIVLLHEFGHSLACRQVGGRADQIVLWPLGGVAYVAPPQRPGAMLWSIAAGPLVNAVLFPLLTAVMVASQGTLGDPAISDAAKYIQTVWYINLGLLIFNLLPIYPLDGGQILRSLLWFFLGRAKSLMATVVVGFIGVAGLMGLALLSQSIWMIILCGFILLNCWRGLLQARLLARAAKLPRRSGYACPACQQPPVQGLFWQCARCFKPFDTFESQAVCPNCGAQFPVTQCLDCGAARPLSQWVQAPPATAPPPI